MWLKTLSLVNFVQHSLLCCNRKAMREELVGKLCVWTGSRKSPQILYDFDELFSWLELASGSSLDSISSSNSRRSKDPPVPPSLIQGFLNKCHTPIEGKPPKRLKPAIKLHQSSSRLDYLGIMMIFLIQRRTIAPRAGMNAHLLWNQDKTRVHAHARQPLVS